MFLKRGIFVARYTEQQISAISNIKSFIDMDNTTIDKIHLCLNEISICKQLLDSLKVDDFCGRLLSIYIMIRADDITRMWSHSLPKGEVERILTDDVKNRYNCNFRLVRDKLGAHYQTATKNKSIDIFENSKIFRSFDYNSVSEFVNELFIAESLIEGKETEYTGFGILDDFNMALEAIDALYADDKASITSSALELFGFNKGGVITFSNEQRKAQFLKGIELMVDYAYTLANKPYCSVGIKRLFKRLLICVIYNYHDNLYTRIEIRADKEQYEEGFDILYKNLYTAKDDTNTLDSVFENFEKLYHTKEYFKKNRKIRDHACGHFDKRSSITEINTALDCLNIDEMYEQYANMLNLFNFICKNIFLLSLLRIPPRSVIYNSRMVSIEGGTNYYGKKLEEVTNLKTMTPDEIMVSLSQKDAHYNEAYAQMCNFLFSGDSERYNQMTTAITLRLREMDGIEADLPEIIEGFRKARRGFPSRLQQTILNQLADQEINQDIKYHLLCILASICTPDSNNNIKNYLQILTNNICYFIKCQAFIGYLHYLISDKTHASRQPHTVDEDFVKRLYCIDNPAGALGIWIALNQRWVLDYEYSFIRKGETLYDRFLKDGLHFSIQAYYTYSNINDEEELRLWEMYEKTNHYLLLLYRVALSEKIKNQGSNLFIELWNNNCFIRYREDIYESFGVGLLTELSGEIGMAEHIFKEILKDYPINKDAHEIHAEFKKRNNIE